MSRRSRKGGASGSGKTKRPPSVAVETQQALELLLDEVHDAVVTRDRERLARAVAMIEAAPPVAPEVITRRLIEGREQAPGLMLTILAQIAADRADVYLQRIVKARNAPDQVRYEAHRLLGWDVYRERKQRRGFLKKLRDPYGTLATSVNSAGLNWPSRIEALTDAEGFLRAFDQPERSEALDRIIEDAGWNAIPLLHGLIHAEDPAVQQRSIDALAGFRFLASKGPLRRLAQAARNEDIRRQVEDVLDNVTFDRTAAPDTSGEAMFPVNDLPPLEWARVTRVEPDGNQSLWVTRELAEGFVELTNIYVTGRSGLVEVTQYGPLTMDILEDDLYEMEGGLAEWTTVDLAVARGLLEYAVDLFGRQTDNAIPFVLELYAPMLHDTYPPEPDEAVVVPILDAAPFAGRTDLVERSAELLEHPLFEGWAFDLDHLALGLATGPMIDPNAPQDEFALAMTERMLNPPYRLVLHDSLRRQAGLLQMAGGNDRRDIALALAAWLLDASNVDLVANQFIAALHQATMTMAVTSLFDIGMFDDPDDDDWMDDLSVDEAIEAGWLPIDDVGEPDSPDR